MGLVLSSKGLQRAPLLSFWRERMQKENGSLQLGRDSLPQPGLAGTLTLDFQPPEHQK